MIDWLPDKALLFPLRFHQTDELCVLCHFLQGIEPGFSDHVLPIYPIPYAEVIRRELVLNGPQDYSCLPASPDCLPRKVNVVASLLYLGANLGYIVLCNEVISVNESDILAFCFVQTLIPCGGYSAILLPDSVRYIGNLAFSFCKNLTEIVLPDSVERIGSQVFYGSEKLDSLTIPDSVIRIGSAIFGSNEALTTVHISPDHPAYMMLDGLLVEKENMRIIGALNNTPAKYVIPEGIKEISFMAFQGSKDLEELTVPDGLINIGSDAFSGCSKLRDIFLPASVTEIGFEAFKYARELVIHAPAGSYAQQYAEDNGKAEQLQELYSLISRLGKLERALILLWLEERSYQEMADILGLSKVNVAVKLNRTKEKLRKMSNR